MKANRHFLLYVTLFIWFIAIWNIFFETAFVDVESASMVPALYPADSFLVFRYASLSRYSIVVFEDPKNPDVELIKRVVGLPGEAIQMRHGRIFINNAPVSEPYITEAYRSQETEPLWAPLLIPDGYYYVLGDNRLLSRDSREFGVVPRSAIHGKVIAVIAPHENRKIFWSY